MTGGDPTDSLALLRLANEVCVADGSAIRAVSAIPHESGGFAVVLRPPDGWAGDWQVIRRLRAQLESIPGVVGVYVEVARIDDS